MAYSYGNPDLSFFARNRGDGHVGFWWLCEDSTTWAAAKNDLKVNFPHFTGLKYSPDEREWTVPLRSLDRLQRWATAWASRQEWDAPPRNGERGRHRSESAQDAPGGALTDAYGVLFLVPAAPLWAAEAVYRAAQKVAHPDTGGDHDRAVALNRAIATIREVQGVQARAS